MKEIQDLHKMNMDDNLVFIDKIGNDKSISSNRKKLYKILAIVFFPIAILLHSKDSERRLKEKYPSKSKDKNKLMSKL